MIAGHIKYRDWDVYIGEEAVHAAVPTMPPGAFIVARPPPEFPLADPKKCWLATRRRMLKPPGEYGPARVALDIAAWDTRPFVPVDQAIEDRTRLHELLCSIDGHVHGVLDDKGEMPTEKFKAPGAWEWKE